MGGDLSTRKVPGATNPADLLTKHVNAADILKHCEDIGLEILDGRASSAPTLATVSLGTSGHGARSSDSWAYEQSGPVRHHAKPRRCLFTPMRVEGSPPAKALTAMRVTKGVYLSSGEDFQIVDNWTARGTAHAELREPWVGSTRFLSRVIINA